MADPIPAIKFVLSDDVKRMLPLSVEVEYLRRAVGDPSVYITDTVRSVIQSNYQLVELPDAQPGSSATIRFLDASAVSRTARDLILAPKGVTSFELDAAGTVALRGSQPRPAAEAPIVVRRGHFVPVTGTFPFAQSTLRVVGVQVNQEQWQARYAPIFKVPELALTALDASAEVSAMVGSFSWSSVHLGIDGSFEFALPMDGDNAWIWWIAGPRALVGVVPDPLSKVRVRSVEIPIPGAKRVPEKVDGMADKACRCSESPVKGVPATVSEAEIVDNPDIYAEDPGAFCKPFSNPERVLSERPFFCVSRVEQPVISSEGAMRLSRVALDLDIGQTPTSKVASVVGALRGGSKETGVLSTGQPTGLITRVSKINIPEPLKNWLETIDRGRKQLDARNPIQWEDAAGRYQASTIARGHILEFRVRWRSNGYSLGTVAKTLTLAPRQTRRIQKIEWQRLEQARREEQTGFAEQVSDVVSHEMTYEDEVRASLAEWARGSSQSSATGVAGGIGFAMGPVVLGGGGAHSNASSSSSQEGGRRTSAAEEQRLQDSIRRYGDSLRKLQSVVVTEVTQEETVEGTTEVIRNSNYAHSLTVIYYQILRHLRVETAFAAVRECLFVPFAIVPFTVERAYRWRELLQRGLLTKGYSQAIRHLKDVLTHFQNSDIPPGRRSDQRIFSLSGSLYIRLGVDRPADATDNQFDESRWAVLQRFLGIPAKGVFARLRALSEDSRDSAFQRDVAPTTAAKWVNTLQLSTNAGLLAADFTLASRYSFNGMMRVDFNVDVSSVITRESLNSLTVKATQDLPAGSVANITRMTFDYQTVHFRNQVSSGTRTDDLVLPDGTIDTLGAVFTFLPSEWERKNERAEIIAAVNDLVLHLNEHAEYYHKVIWWNMDRDRLYMLIDGFYVPGTGASIASVVERDPIAILGNCLVYRVSAGAFLGLGDIKTPEELHNYYAHRQTPSDPMHISLPTDGLYAQTLMDECNALEEHYGNLDWVLDQPDPDLGNLDPSLLLTRRAEPVSTTPTPLPASIINLQNAPSAPAPSGLGGVLNAVTNPGAFRDMAGLAGTQSLAQASMQTAANLATNFGNQAAALEMAKVAGKAHATETADRKVAAIDRAREKGLLTPDQAQQQASNVFGDLTTPVGGDSPPREAALTETIRAASLKPGSKVEATTPEGSVKVSLASADMSRLLGAGAPKPIANKSSKAAASAKIAELRAQGNAPRWKISQAVLSDRMQEIVDEPAHVQQDNLNLCGPAAFLRHWLQRDPGSVVDFARDLYLTGKGAIGGYEVEPSGDSLIAQDYDAFAAAYPNFAPCADWMICGSLRDAENAILDYEGRPDEEVPGITTPNEIVTWLDATGLYATVKNEANLVATKGVDHALSLRPGELNDVVLLINLNMLAAGDVPAGSLIELIKGEFPNHYVVLNKDITETAAGIHIEYWCWGQDFVRDIPKDRFESNYYGAIIGAGAA